MSLGFARSSSSRAPSRRASKGKTTAIASSPRGSRGSTTPLVGRPLEATDFFDVFCRFLFSFQQQRTTSSIHHHPTTPVTPCVSPNVRSSCFLYFSRLLYLTKNFDVVCVFSWRSVFFVFYAMARSGLRQKMDYLLLCARRRGPVRACLAAATTARVRSLTRKITNSSLAREGSGRNPSIHRLIFSAHGRKFQ